MSLPPYEQRKRDALNKTEVEVEVPDRSVYLGKDFIAIYTLIGGTILSTIGIGLAFGLPWSFVVLGVLLLTFGSLLGTNSTKGI